MKKLTAVLCLLLCAAVGAQSPRGKVVVLEKNEGEKRVRRPRGEPPFPSMSEFILKVTPENSGSSRLVLGTETIPPGRGISKHRHEGQDEILYIQTGAAKVTLNDKPYDVHAGAVVFFPMHTWISLQNTGQEDIQLLFVFSAPGFEQYLRCTSVPSGQSASPITPDGLRECSHKGHVEYDALMTPPKKS